MTKTCWQPSKRAVRSSWIRASTAPGCVSRQRTSRPVATALTPVPRLLSNDTPDKLRRAQLAISLIRKGGLTTASRVVQWPARPQVKATSELGGGDLMRRSFAIRAMPGESQARPVTRVPLFGCLDSRLRQPACKYAEPCSEGVQFQNVSQARGIRMDSQSLARGLWESISQIKSKGTGFRRVQP